MGQALTREEVLKIEILGIESEWDHLVAWEDTIKDRLSKKGIERFRVMYELPRVSDLEDWMGERLCGLMERYALARNLTEVEAEMLLYHRPRIDIVELWKKHF